MPEQILKKIKNNITSQVRACFLSALIVGLLAHLYKITGWLPNWDSLVFRYDSQNMLGLGRWFLQPVCAISSYYDLPFLNGILCILFHSLGAVCICKIFNVKKNFTAALVGGAVVSFPGVTSVLMYNYVADGYAIAFLFACLGAFFITSKKPKYVVAVVFITLSVAIYQAYITVTVMLILACFLNKVVFEKENSKLMLKKTIAAALTGFVGMALYYLILNIIVYITGTSLLDYQGVSSTVSLANINVFASLYVVKEVCLNFFFDFSNGIFGLINILVFAVLFVAYIKGIIKNKIQKSPLSVLLVVVYVLLMPVGSVLLAFINSSIDYHNLMKMGFCIFYIMFIVLYERVLFKKSNLEQFKVWIVFVLGVVLVLNQVVISNISYHKAQMSYEKSYGTLIRIVDRIEQIDKSQSCEKLMAIGQLDGSEPYSVNLPPDITGVTDGYILRADDESVGQSVFCSTVNDYCHKNYQFVYGEEKINMLKNPQIEDMKPWPSENSIKIVDDTVVVMLGTERE